MARPAPAPTAHDLLNRIRELRATQRAEYEAREREIEATLRELEQRLNELALDMLTVPDFAVLTKLGESTIHDHIKRGLIPATRIGKRVLIPRLEAEAILRSRHVPAPPTLVADTAPIARRPRRSMRSA